MVPWKRVYALLAVGRVFGGLERDREAFTWDMVGDGSLHGVLPQEHAIVGG